MSAKCPTCGQAMPKVEGWKVDARDLGPSHYVDGALAWFGDGEEGGSLEQSSLGMNAAEELAKQARMYIEDRSVENKAEVDFFAIEAAAHERSRGRRVRRQPSSTARASSQQKR